MRIQQLAWLALPLVAACASVDPTNDIAASAAAANEQLGVPPDFAAPWDAAPAWDGLAPLSADEAVHIALRTNRELRSSVAAVAAARASLATAETPPNPMLAVSIGFPIEAMTTGVTAAAMQQLAWLWQRPSRVAAEDARLRAATLDAADRAVATAARIRREFAAVVAAEATLAARERGYEAAAKALAAMDAAVAAGAAPAFERRTAVDAEAMARRDRCMATEELIAAKLALLTTLGLADRPIGWTTDGVWPTPPARAVAAIDAAEQRLDVVAARWRVEAAAADARTAQASRVGSFSAGVMYERMTDGDQSLGPAFEVELPIFDRGDPRVAASVAALEQARLAADQVRQAALAEARSAEAMAELAERRLVDGSDVRRAIAATTLTQIESQVAAGTASPLERAMAAMALANRESEAIADRLAATVAAIDLARSLGAPSASPASSAPVVARGGAH